MKTIPNIISILRIALALSLIFIKPLSTAFMAVYILAGVSDMIDGPLARKLDAQSRLGSKLDSIGDFVFLAVVAIRLWNIIDPSIAIIFWCAAIVFLRFFSCATASRRFGATGLLHTWLNRLTGAALFVYPFILSFSNSRLILWLLCSLATLSAVEELIIELTANSFNPDRKSIFLKERGNAQN